MLSLRSFFSSLLRARVARSSFAVVALSLGVVAFSACSAEAPDDGNADESYQNHTVGQHIHKNSRYLWVDSTFEEADQLATAYGSETHATVGEGDDLVRWLQTWSDRIDAEVRGDVERKTGQKFVAPKPIVKVLKTHNTLNAWVTSLPACVGAPFNLASGETAPGMTAHLDVTGVQAGDVPCLKTKGWVPKELATVFNTGKHACELSFDQSFHVKAGCPGAESKAEETTVLATTPYIRFASDLLARFTDERSVIVVLAHELAHYYRSHGSPMYSHKYNFWYDQGATVARRPVPAKNAAEIQELYAEVLSGARPIGGETWQTKVSARVRPFLVEGLGPLLVQRTGNFVCEAAANLARAGLPTLRPGEEATPEQQTAYVRYETAMLACAANWRIVETNPGANEIAAADLLVAVGLGQEAPASIAAGKSVADVIAELQAAAVKRDATAKTLLGKLRQNRIGRYTTEQEADDLAMELAVRVGFEPNDVLAGWTGFLDAIEGYYLDAGLSREELLAQYQQTGDIDAATCKGYLAAGFMKEDKKTPITVTIGVLEDKHHTSCYRLYNLWREAKAHKYVKGPAKPALSPAWETLRMSAEAISKNAVPAVSDAGAGTDSGASDGGASDAGRD